MNKEQAIMQLEYRKDFATPDQIEALDMAISALSEELSEDGTLTVHVSDGSKVNRVFVMGDNIFGGLYYPDSAENKRDLISRGEVESVLHNNLHALIDTDQLYQLYKDINCLPIYSFPDSAEGEWIPISERLPEEKKTVLVWCPQYKNIYCAYLEKEQWWIYGAFVQIVPSEVVAWQSLPEPYKKGE